MVESHQALNSEQLAKIRRLETEISSLNERLSVETRVRHNDQGSLEKKLTEAVEREERLAVELEEVKAERHRRVTEYQKQLEKDKESFKGRLADAERKAKEAEQRRSQLLFSVEKEKANWVLEVDHLKRK